MTTTRTILTAALILGAFMGGANARELKANSKPQAPGSIAAPAQPSSCSARRPGWHSRLRSQFPDPGVKLVIRTLTRIRTLRPTGRFQA